MPGLSFVQYAHSCTVCHERFTNKSARDTHRRTHNRTLKSTVVPGVQLEFAKPDSDHATCLCKRTMTISTLRLHVMECSVCIRVAGKMKNPRKHTKPTTKWMAPRIESSSPEYLSTDGSPAPPRILTRRLSHMTVSKNRSPSPLRLRNRRISRVMASSSPEPLSIPCRVSPDCPPPPRSRHRFSRVISSSPEPPGSSENPPSAALSESSGRQLVKYMEPWWQKNIGWADEPEERWISTLQRLVDLSYTQAHLHAWDVPDLPVDAFCRFGMHFYMFLLDASEKHSDAYDIPDDLIDACMVLRNVLETDLDGAFMAGRAWETFCDLNIALWMCWFCPKTTDGVLANVVVGYLYKALQTGMKLETCVMWIATWARIAVFLVYRERPVECCEREKEMIMALFQFYVRECMPTPYGALFQAYEQNLKK